VPRRADLTAYALLLCAVLLGVVLWSALPERMAVHFGPGGSPDSYVSRPVAVVLAPTVGAGAVLLVRHAPEWTSSSDAPAVESVAVLFVGVTVAGLQTFVYAWNLGARISPALVTGVVLAGAALLVWYVRARG
jgi:uncharacterized membrane protein